MALTLSKPSELKAWGKKNKRLALAVVAAQAFAEMERERVNAYVRPIFDRYGFTRSPAYGGNGEPISKVDDLYLCEDPRIPEFYEECDKAHRAHGFTGKAGYCPALVAISNRIEAENALLEAGWAMMGCEDRGPYCATDVRAQTLRLLLEICVNA